MADELPIPPALRALTLLSDPKRAIIDARDWTIVLAHPDDETIGLGAQLWRLRGARLVLVTDGAPRTLADAKAHGFADATSYSAARDEELAGALAAGGAQDMVVERLGYADQETANNLGPLARDLKKRLAGTAIVLTHAYEGGHPDHDATAFAVHAAVAALPEAQRPAILDMPFYRLGTNGDLLVQDFEPSPGYMPILLELLPDERERKQRMLDAHATQRQVLKQFPPAHETFRQAPPYDFGELPNGGRLWYECYDWGLDGTRWRERVRDARGGR